MITEIPPVLALQLAQACPLIRGEYICTLTAVGLVLAAPGGKDS